MQPTSFLHRLTASLLCGVLCGLLACPPRLALASEDVSEQEESAFDLQLELEEAREPVAETDPRGDWDVTADRVQANDEYGYVEAWGNVILLQGANRLQADYVRYFKDSGWVFMRGKVFAKWDGYDIYAREAEFDLFNSTGWMRDGYIYSPQDEMYIRGKQINKVGENVYTFESAEVTACEGDDPAWSVYADEGDLTTKDRINLWGPRFQVENVPVLYSPYASFSLRTERETGFLVPEWGFSEQLGDFVSLPLFIVTGTESDITLYETWLGKRGFKHGAELRATPDTASEILLQASYINDRETNDSLSEDHPYDDDTLIRPNENRWWVRGMADLVVPHTEWELRANIDYASDQDYLREMGIGFQSYGASDGQLEGQFGRSINTADSQERESAALLTRTFDDLYSLNIKGTYTQDLAYRNSNLNPDTNPTLQRLPELSAYAFKRALPGTPLEWEAEVRATDFRREFGTTGQRVDVIPRLSLPFDTGPVGITPTVSWLQSFWFINDYENTAAEVDTGEKTPSRGIPQFEVTAFSEAFRVYELGTGEANIREGLEYVDNSAWTAVRHSIQPRIVYTHIPQLDQDDLPDFDGNDSISETNNITYSLANILGRRKESVVEMSEGGHKVSALERDYRDFFELRLEQTYDFVEADRQNQVETFERRPFSDLEARLSFSPGGGFSFSSASYYNFYEAAIIQQDFGVAFDLDTFGYHSINYSMVDPVVEFDRERTESYQMLTHGLSLDLPGGFSLTNNLQYDLNANDFVNSNTKLTFEHQCYMAYLTYVYTGTSYSLSFWFTILEFASPTVSTASGAGANVGGL